MNELEKIGEMIGRAIGNSDNAKYAPVNLDINRIDAEIDAKPLADAIELGGKRNAAALESALLIVADSLGRSILDSLSNIPEPKSNADIAKRLAEVVETLGKDDLIKLVDAIVKELSSGVKATRLLATEVARNTSAIEENTKAVKADRLFTYDDQGRVKKVSVRKGLN